MTIHLTTEEEAMIRERVETGRFPDIESAIHAAVRLLVQSDREMEWLERELQIGIDQADRGELIDFTPELVEQIMERVRREAGTKQKYKDAILP